MGLVAYCGFTGSPSQLRQPETVKFRVWCLRMVSTDVGVIGGSGLNDWMEYRGASWIAVPVVACMLLGAWIL